MSTVEGEVAESSGASPIQVILFILMIVSFALCGTLFLRLHTINAMLEQQNRALGALQASELALSNQASLNTTVANQLGGQTILASLQMMLLQGQPKNILQRNAQALQQILSHANNADLASLSATLNSNINALPEINPFDALIRLNQINQSFAALSFVPAVGVQTAVVVPPQIQGFWQRLWYSIRGFLVIRTDNQIGSSLVTDVSRFDALRTLNLLVQEAEWQIVHNQDPSNSLAQLQSTLTLLTAEDANQKAVLAEINALLVSDDFYTAKEVSAVLNSIGALQAKI